MKINEKNLSAFSTTSSEVQKEGYLLKRGEVNRAFQRRWFVLKCNLLFYFEKKGDKEPLGVIIMEGCTIELAECDEQPCCFRIVFPAREYILAADNQEMLESWMKNLARCSYAYLKLMVAELEMQVKELNDSEGVDKNCCNIGGQPQQRMNPFNTPEENRNFAELWECGREESQSGEQVSMSRPRSNTVTGSSDSNNKSKTVWHNDSLNNNNHHPSPPVPPRRMKKRVQSYKISGLRKPPNRPAVPPTEPSKTISTKDDPYFYQHPTKLMFAQLHMDYGAAILKEWDMYWLKSRGYGDETLISHNKGDEKLISDNSTKVDEINPTQNSKLIANDNAAFSSKLVDL